jgi:MazG family protein
LDTHQKMTDPTSTLKKLMQLVATLRGESGCPWDRKQTPRSMAVYLTEEVFELAEAIESGDRRAVCEELGDVLFQILFIVFLFEESGDFDIETVAHQNTAKMIRRHPHVFGDTTVANTEEVKQNWHAIKQSEKKNSAQGSALDSIPGKLPALLRAYRISERAARTGFDWDDLKGVMHKVEEEWSEFRAEVDRKPSDDQGRERLALEFGDILFTLVNVARFAHLHPETALAASTHKFEKRFRKMERMAGARQQTLETVSRQQWDRLWEEVKRSEDGG